MRVLKQTLFLAFCMAALAVGAMAQKPDDKNRPPKDPPTIPAPDKEKPRDRPPSNSNRPQKPNQVMFIRED